LGPSPIHAKNVYLVLNLITGCLSPQYHCRFDDFFEPTHHGGPDVNSTICWQQLAGLTCASLITANFACPTQPTTTVPQDLSDAMVPSDDHSISQIDYDDAPDDHSVLDEDSQVTRSSRASCPPRASQQAEGVNPMIEPTVTAGISQRGRIRTMSKKMAESTSQKNFFGTSGMHYMANKSTTAFDETAQDLFHDQHLEIQERMRNPLAFHAGMMGDIMYF
jgi:hypothetical protein